MEELNRPLLLNFIMGPILAFVYFIMCMSDNDRARTYPELYKKDRLDTKLKVYKMLGRCLVIALIPFPILAGVFFGNLLLILKDGVVGFYKLPRR